MHLSHHNYELVKRLAGFDYDPRKEQEVESAIKAISEKEGWVFYSIKQESNDPIFRRISGSKTPPWEKHL